MDRPMITDGEPLSHEASREDYVFIILPVDITTQRNVMSTIWAHLSSMSLPTMIGGVVK